MGGRACVRRERASITAEGWWEQRGRRRRGSCFPTLLFRLWTLRAQCNQQLWEDALVTGVVEVLGGRQSSPAVVISSSTRLTSTVNGDHFCRACNTMEMRMCQVDTRSEEDDATQVRILPGSPGMQLSCPRPLVLVASPLGFDKEQKCMTSTLNGVVLVPDFQRVLASGYAPILLGPQQS